MHFALNFCPTSNEFQLELQLGYKFVYWAFEREICFFLGDNRCFDNNFIVVVVEDVG